MKKESIRKIYLEKRKLLSENEIKEYSTQIKKQIIGYFDIKPYSKIHIFYPIKKRKEVDTTLLIQYFFEKKCRVYLPKIYNNTIKAIEITPETCFIENKWGILEPLDTNETEISDSFDLIIIPLLYCDSKGNRIGYGKGFYDDFLKEQKYRKNKIGINFFDSLEEIDDIRKEDIPLDYLVTPSKVIGFGNGEEKKSTK